MIESESLMHCKKFMTAFSARNGYIWFQCNKCGTIIHIRKDLLKIKNVI